MGGDGAHVVACSTVDCSEACPRIASSSRRAKTASRVPAPAAGEAEVEGEGCKRGERHGEGDEVSRVARGGGAQVKGSVEGQATHVDVGRAAGAAKRPCPLDSKRFGGTAKRRRARLGAGRHRPYAACTVRRTRLQRSGRSGRLAADLVGLLEWMTVWLCSGARGNVCQLSGTGGTRSVRQPCRSSVCRPRLREARGVGAREEGEGRVEELAAAREGAAARAHLVRVSDRGWDRGERWVGIGVRDGLG